MKVRLPCVAGQFYEKEPELLARQVTACLPEKPKRKQKAIAVQVPHAGLMYSGPVAGEVYASIEWPPTVILLGPNHTGEGSPISMTQAEYWRTPLGDVEVDDELASHLQRHAPELVVDETAHRFEHSIEVQLPFLQQLSKKTKIIPIILSWERAELYKQFGRHLAEAVSALQKEVLVIASSDMTHYESHESAKEKDDYAIQAILSLDGDELGQRLRARRISMCGYAPVMAALSYALQRGAGRGELLCYQTSGDATGDYSSVVGYAGIRILSP
ncbi:MAG: AmmeMemoRadiSam system protein B [Candidatus Omnitrophota bacterium]